ncbi:MAG: hypothetical protein CM15mP62_21230 [Rhodospirillaceae bacterium]|nr:MAG: hypothetical protein CM15mP62_21230 [Rhodospirillaceae bacterium]
MLFITLGPSGTNHEFVTQNYLRFRKLKDADIKLIDNFFFGLEMMADGRADYMVQAAVHPDCSDLVAKAHFLYGISVVDTFIFPGKQLALLSRVDINKPRRVAFQPATRHYVALKIGKNIFREFHMHVAEGLLSGAYDSGITFLDIAEKHSTKLRVEIKIGTVDDPWIVYGKQDVFNGEIIAAPSASFYDST